MHAYIAGIQEEFASAGNEKKAVAAKAYLRDQFTFIGLPSSLRRELAKTYLKKWLPDKKDLSAIVRELWDMPEREYQYFGIELLFAVKNDWNKKTIRLIEFCLGHKSWWDTVDYASAELSGPYFIRFPDRIGPVTRSWNRSGDIWMQRSSLLFQLKYRKYTGTRLLASYINNLSGSDEFFVQKAIGWALREYSKTDPLWVENFVRKHALSPLSRKEALKRIVK